MGTHLPAVHSASLEFHHPVVLTGPPSIVATACGGYAASRSALGLDGSIMIASACHRRRYGCAVPSELLAHVACRFFPDSRRKVKDALYYSVFKEQPVFLK